MKKIAGFIFLAFVSLLLWATDVRAGYIYGNVEVDYNNELPSGLFAKTKNYLPGDSLRIANPFTGEEVVVLNLGALDDDREEAILLSQEAANKLDWDMNQPSYIRITDRDSDYDDIASGSAMLTHDKNRAGEWVFAGDDNYDSVMPNVPEEHEAYIDETPPDVVAELADDERGASEDVSNDLPPEYIDNLDDFVADTDSTPVEDFVYEKEEPLASLPTDIDDYPRQDPYEETFDSDRDAVPVTEDVVEEHIASDPAKENASSPKDIFANDTFEDVVETVPVRSPNKSTEKIVDSQNTLVPHKDTVPVEESVVRKPKQNIANEDIEEPVEIIAEEYVSRPKKKIEPVAEPKVEPATEVGVTRKPAAPVVKPVEDSAYEYTDELIEGKKRGKVETSVEPVKKESPVLEEKVTPKKSVPLDDKKTTVEPSVTVVPSAFEEVVKKSPSTKVEPIAKLEPVSDVKPVDTVPVVEKNNKVESTENHIVPVTEDKVVRDTVSEDRNSSSDAADDSTDEVIVEKSDRPVLNPLSYDDRRDVKTEEDEYLSTRDDNTGFSDTVSDDTDELLYTSEDKIQLVPSANVAPPADAVIYKPVVKEDNTSASKSQDDYDIEVNKKDVVMLHPTDAKAPTGAVPSVKDDKKNEKQPVVIKPAPVTSAPSTSSGTAGTKKAKLVQDSNLKKNFCYIQITSVTSDSEADALANKYKKYPIVKVPFEKREGYKIMVGPVTEDESGAILEKFKSYGYKDAYERKIK